MSNTVTIGADVVQTTVYINVRTPAPNPTVHISGSQNLTLTPNANGWAQATLPPGAWTACAESGGSGTIYQASNDCTTFSIPVIPTAATGATGTIRPTGTTGTPGSGGAKSVPGQPPHLAVRLTRTGQRVHVTVRLARHADERCVSLPETNAARA